MGKDKCILIKFNQHLTGNIAGAFETQVFQIATNKPSFSSGDYVGRESMYAFNGSTSSTNYWRSKVSTPPVWLGVDLEGIYPINKVRVYNISYIPKDFILQGSMDNETWTDVYIGQMVNSSGWQEFSFPPSPFRYFRIYITSKWSASYIYIYEVELYYTKIVGNERAFLLRDNEGNLFRTEKVERYNDNTILLRTEKFNNAVDKLTVIYDSSLGDIAGANGRVESFVKQFSPKDLIPTYGVTRENVIIDILGLNFSLIDNPYPEYNHINYVNRDNISASLDLKFNIVDSPRPVVNEISLSNRDNVSASLHGLKFSLKEA